MKMNLTDNFRLAAEWERQSEVLLSLPHPDTDWEHMLPSVHKCYASILACLLKYDAAPCLLVPSVEYARKVLPAESLNGVALVEIDYNDTWIRDYGPLTLIATDKDGRRVWRRADFGFNGWGLKFAADKDNLVTHRIFGPGSDTDASHRYADFLNYVLEGGSVETDGLGTLLTTSRCLCSLNRNGGLSKEEVEKFLSKYLGINHFLWLDYGALDGDDTDSHIDTLARLCPHDTILFTGCADPDDSHYKELSLMKEELKAMRTVDGRPYNLIELPLPKPVYDEDDGHRLPATYANYLVTNKAVLVPEYGQPRLDGLARQIIKVAYPDRVVEGVDCLPLIRQHGSLHCATMQLNV